MSQVLDCLIGNNKTKGLTLEDIASKLQSLTDRVLYISHDSLHDAGTYEEACYKFLGDDQEYIVISSTAMPYVCWTLQRKPSSLQRYCIDKLYTFFDKTFVDMLLTKRLNSE